jgi:glycine betaine/proline transport system substrate-binding protein
MLEKRFFLSLITLGMVFIILISSCASLENLPLIGDSLPGKGETVKMGQATWDTGWFQAQVFKILLEELGYEVKDPETLNNVAFYIFLAQGDLDFWANGWFPLHDRYIGFKEVIGNVEPIGYLVDDGALQGYMIDRATAEEFEITNLEDLADPDIAKIFDKDGDGKADLIGCNEEWGCEVVIEHHLNAFGLHDTVEHIQGEYSELMEETILRHKNGEPVLFYTWTPNWTVSELEIGEDVIWLSVPHSSLPDNPAALTETESMPGCLEMPCNLGFEFSDIRVVANIEFLKNNPAAAKLFELAEIPLEDIAAQNASMHAGEDSPEEIQHHAEEWIAANRDLVDGWLSEAITAAQ